ncbi:MAG: glycosyltransferase family 39 protein [Candidatus Micrarchaeia archaeon]
MFWLGSGEKDRVLPLILLAVYLLSRLPVLGLLPMVLDEGLYSVMIEEQRSHPTLIPTYLDHQVSWKPSPFFWIYGILSQPLLALGLPAEVAYRFPSFLFGMLSVPLLYSLMRKTGSSPAVAFISGIVFLFSSVSLYAETSLLTDSPLLFFVLASFYIYIDGRFGRARFIAAGLLAACAFFFKLVFAFVPLALALAYFAVKDRKVLRDPVFILSLLFVPAVLAGDYLLLQSAGLGDELFFGDIGSHLVSASGILGQVNGSINSITLLIVYLPFWFALSFFGFARNWRGNLLMSFWFLLMIPALVSNNTMPWYFLPVLPAISYFVAVLLVRHEGKERMDLFMGLVLAGLIIMTMALDLYLRFEELRFFNAEKEAGTMLAGKADVLVIGTYTPSLIAYKTLPERKAWGSPLDFGWVLLGPDANRTMYDDFVRDYMNDRYEVVQGSMSSGFSRPIIFRKDSNITRFSYIVVSGPSDYTPSGKEIYSSSSPRIRVYEVD